VIDTFSAMICGSPVCSASPSSGTSPASDTRLSSSNRAEPEPPWAVERLLI
jgi:hypothetical protein